MHNREELGFWAYLLIFLAVLLAMAINIKEIRNSYAGENPLDMRHPWSKSPDGYIQPQPDAPPAEYATRVE